MNAVRLGVIRGWIEFQIYYLKDLQSLIGTVIIALLLVGVLWFERATNIGGISLALLTLPGLLSMLIANEGFSNVARFLSSHREDGTLLRAKAIPQGMLGYVMDCPDFSCLLARVGPSFGVFPASCSRVGTGRIVSTTGNISCPCCLDGCRFAPGAAYVTPHGTTYLGE